MKKFIVFTFIFLGFLRLQAQNQLFEGTVKYTHYLEITDTTMKKQDMALSLYFGSASILYIKQGHYHWKFADCSQESQTYIPTTNTIYDKFVKNDTLYTTNAGIANETIAQEEVKDSKTVVLGEKCKVMIVKSKFPSSGDKRIRLYYFGKKYTLHPDFYQKYKMNANDKIFAKMGTIPLRFTVVYPSFKITYVAAEIKRTTVDLKLFDVKGKKTKPLPTQK
ncbi:MAG: hypothetical protein MUC49_17600 [Raineya sp.]|jgi:hypothetical protein|nr:hypothetical protein [Raineya sp.]